MTIHYFDIGFFVLDSLAELDDATESIHITQYNQQPIKSNGIKHRRKSHRGSRH